MKILSSSFRQILFATIFASPHVQADLLLYEGFDHAEEEPLNTQNGGTGWESAWSTVLVTTGAEDAQHSVGSGFSFASLTVVGGSTERSIRNGRSSATRSISLETSIAITADNSTIWFSLLMDPTINTAAGAGQSFNTYGTLLFGNESLTDASIGNQAGGGTLIANSGDGVGVGFFGIVSATGFPGVGIQGVTFSGGEITQDNGETNAVVTGDVVSLIVGKIDWAASGSEDTLTLYNIIDTQSPLPEPFAVMTLDVEQSDFDTISIADGQTSGFDEIRFGESLTDVIPGISLPAFPVGPVLNISQSGGNLDFEWMSTAGNRYSILSDIDFTQVPSDWPVFDDGTGPFENIEASGTGTNTLTGLALVGDTRFFVLLEEAILPTAVLSADFEADSGGFTVIAGGTGSSWENGFPDGSGPGGAILGGSGTPNLGAWGTLLGNVSTVPAETGQFEQGTSTILSSPVIDLTAFTVSATLDFDENLDFEDPDTGEVYLVNNATGADIGTAPIYIAVDADPATTGWEPVPQISLPAEALGQQIRIEFRFNDNGGQFNDFLGWYIDNVLVQGI